MILADQMGRVGVATAKQRDIIAVLADRNRQAAGEPCYSGKVPALREAFRRTFEGAVEGKGPAVAEYEIVSDVERSEEHTSELQSQSNLVCRLLLEIKTVFSVNSVDVKATATAEASPANAVTCVQPCMIPDKCLGWQAPTCPLVHFD